MLFSNQYMESLNSTLQTMAPNVPRLKKPSANVNMTSRVGDQLTPHECEDLHQ